MAFQRHGFEAFGHIGFVHTLQVHGHTGFLEHHVHHQTEVGTGRVAQVRQGGIVAPRQAKQGLALGIGQRHRRHHFLPQAHHFVACAVKLEGLGLVVVGNQQVAAAFDQTHHRIVHIEGNQAAFDGAKTLLQAADPGREEGEGQGVGHGKLYEVLARRGMAAQHGARTLQGLEHFQ